MALLFVFACAEDDYVATEGLCPTVASTTPADNDVNVPLNQVISATFNKLMDTSTITATSFTVNGPNPIVGVLTFDSTATATTVHFTPSSNLLLNTTYTGIITTSVKDTMGNAMQVNYVWSFSTGNSIIPKVIATDPINGSTNVPLNKIITATFSQIMNPATVTPASFRVSNGTANITGAFTFSGAKVIFTPSAQLTANTNYTATITTAVKNSNGVGMTTDYVWTFSTGTTLTPLVLVTNPVNLENNVPLNKIITATFNQVMNPATVTNASFKVMDGGTPVNGTFSFSGATVLFTPSATLMSNTTYTATITTAVKNSAGVGMTNDYVWSFTTLASTIGGPDVRSLLNVGGLGGNAGITNQGLNTVINGGIATTAASTLVTGFHDGLTADVYTETPLNKGLVTGGIFTAPPFPGTATSFAFAQQAVMDANALYNDLSPASMPGGIDPGAGQLGGLTLPPGIYKAAGGSFGIAGSNLTLDAQGDPNAVFVFQCASGLTVGSAGPAGARSIILINGASAKNVYWQVGSAATINAAGGGVMVGTIVASAGVTLSTSGNAVQTVLNGRAISLVASVTMVNTTINVPQ
ncbi:Ig-like domain-containing protein [Flavobacterium sp. GT3R68]|uniref:Ig-like domain-containing protein n=1 Tax=Flavobacterium sp. GT3R68 TaxID=2594437 RepID=UPI002107625B|nr:Ig-like domain-containing protein [Flavobacterium sp. GT3R68]